jgi:hypothetical protein
MILLRRSRRWLTGLMILGFIGAEFISLAHACTTGSDETGPPISIAAHAAAMSADCPMMGQRGLANDPACDTHCFPREQADRGTDGPLPALAPPAVPVFRLVPAFVDDRAFAKPPLPRIASPPLSLLFGRFLI